MMRNKQKATRGRASKGTILMIAALLISSAVIRLGIGAGPAIAKVVTKSETTGKAAANSPSLNPAEKKSRPIQAPKNRAEIGNLLESLIARETQLRDHERKMQMRKKALEIAGREIEKRMLDLEQVELRLRQTLSLADGAAEGDLAQLTAVYENMKAKDAAALFETMDPPFAAGFLGRMRPDTAAAIMAGLTPEIAYTISIILASRSANAPKT